MNDLGCLPKKYLILSIFLTIFFVVLVISKPIFSADNNWVNFNPEWRFQDKVVEMSLSYSEDRQRGKLEVKLKDKVNIDKYEIIYYLNNQRDEKPQLLISENGKDYFPKNNFKIMLRQNSKKQTYWFKLNKDISNRAGMYQFDFQSSSGLQKGPIISIELRLNKLAQIVVTPSRANIKMNAGPGGYELEKSIQVKVKTNYPEWSLGAIAKPLSYIGEKNSLNISNKEQSVIPINRMKLVYDEKEINLDEDEIVIERVKDQYTKNFFLKLQIDLVWKDQAGQYDSGGLEFRVVN